MSIYQTARDEMQRILDAMPPNQSASARGLALACFNNHKPRFWHRDEFLDHFTLDGLTQVARSMLRGNYDSDRDNDSDIRQGELWTGKFQARYSVGDEYKPWAILTVAEKRLVGEEFLKASRAFAEHGNAILADADRQEREEAMGHAA